VTAAAAPETVGYDAARFAHGAALEAWRRLKREEQELATGSVLTTDDGPRRLDELERELELQRIREERPRAARALAEARETWHAARVARANETLAGLSPRYAEAAEAVDQRRARLERAYIALLAEAIALGELLPVEQRAAQKLIEAAADAANTEEARADVKWRGANQVPFAVDLNGPTETADRPDVSMWGYGGDRFDPRKRASWDELGVLALNGRGSALGGLPEKLAAKLAKALTKTTTETNT
jgi:hypothetical protein